jgi:uncharacterized protein (TIGR00297 family)
MKGDALVGKTTQRLGGAAGLSALVGLAARRRGALTTSGAVGAFVTGTAIAGAGGWDWGLTLVYFFASSSALSRVATARKAAIAADKFAKGSQRDLSQALANGGAAAALALLRAFPWGQRRASLLEDAFIGALATANADTWATEIGTLSAHAPRLITTGQSVAPGTSGGVTLLGLAATVAGAATLGGAFGLARAALPLATHSAHEIRGGAWASLRAAVVGGVVGAMTDSVLGATLQGVYRCPKCGSETERQRHACGAPTEYLRGLRWLDNDAVNALSTLAGAAAGAVTGLVWRVRQR